jgi:spore photoproduct lyase
MIDYSKYSFTKSQLQILKNIEIDLSMWAEKSLSEVFPYELEDKYTNKQLSKKIFEYIVNYHDELKNRPNNYDSFKEIEYKSKKFEFEEIAMSGVGLGSCPVASEGTRCCNLLTLDAVQSCGFDCSYCSIQSFYNENKIGFDKEFKQKLQNLKLDPNKTYHIGTGQSSDSLMWGNREGILDALFDFARGNPNVILEFKTKSNNIKYLLHNKVPPNIIVTWSLNTQTIIDNEEHLTASLKERIDSARALADIGVIVGFHFHPIVEYEGYLDEYRAIYDELLQRFDHKEVALVSLGTLTFIKPVIKKLRQRELKTKILQMPFVNINGKQSYSLKTKKEMFTHAYKSFQPWHNRVYFYLCMEDHSLWKEVFGYEYSSNNQFEDFMLRNYMDKIQSNSLES